MYTVYKIQNLVEQVPETGSADVGKRHGYQDPNPKERSRLKDWAGSRDGLGGRDAEARLNPER